MKNIQWREIPDFRESPTKPLNTEVHDVHTRINTLIYHIDRLEDRIKELESQKAE